MDDGRHDADGVLTSEQVVRARWHGERLAGVGIAMPAARASATQSPANNVCMA